MTHISYFVERWYLKMYVYWYGRCFCDYYLFLWNKNFKAQQTLLYNDYLNSLNLCKISEETKHDI